MTDNELKEERLLSEAGVRYKNSTFKTFECGSDHYTVKRRTALNSAISYFRDGQNTIMQGSNLVLYGTSGTGKDHLAIAVARRCASIGFTARFISGQSLFAAAERARRTGQDQVDSSLMTARVLVLSDPLVNATTPRDDELKILMLLLDERYRHKRPTIVTANAEDETDLRESLRGPLADRLLGSGAILVETRWPSFRGKQK